MALPTTTISMSQVNTELGRSATASINLNESAVRTLAGVASGTISMNNLRGKSNVSFSPDGGTSAGTRVLLQDQGSLYASVTISCSQSAVWTWSGGGGGSPYVSVSSGGSATSIIFEVSASVFGGWAVANFTVQATAGGITRYWSIELIAEDNS